MWASYAGPHGKLLLGQRRAKGQAHPSSTARWPNRGPSLDQRIGICLGATVLLCYWGRWKPNLAPRCESGISTWPIVGPMEQCSRGTYSLKCVHYEQRNRRKIQALASHVKISTLTKGYFQANLANTNTPFVRERQANYDRNLMKTTPYSYKQN